MSSAEAAAKAAEDYVVEQHRPLAACIVSTNPHRGGWMVEAAIVRNKKGKLALETFTVEVTKELEPIRCQPRRALSFDSSTGR